MSNQAEQEEHRLRDSIVKYGALLYQRGLAHGSAGNISVRLEGGSILLTPTNSSLGDLDPDTISKLAPDGTLISGDSPSKEGFFHVAIYEERAQAKAIVHVHSTHSVAVACLCHADTTNVLPALTAYQIMCVGRLPLVPYFRPGDRKLADAVRTAARQTSAMLLANHGPIISARSLAEAVYASEELEETAKIFFLIGERKANLLTCEAIQGIEATFQN
jgi:ribulose-5-phosphate 4-epimerase/fuculose-1-phosphate aldolase